MSKAIRRRRVRFFLSYAHADQVLVESFLREFEKQYKAAAHYDYGVWRDSQIPIGAAWLNEIAAASRDCDFGLFLISPAFLGSESVRRYEYPRAQKPLFVGLDKVHWRYQAPKSLQARQVFLQGGRFFGELSSARQKREFAHELFARIHAQLDAFYSAPGRP